jgi:hypothetical protein
MVHRDVTPGKLLSVFLAPERISLELSLPKLIPIQW